MVGMPLIYTKGKLQKAPDHWTHRGIRIWHLPFDGKAHLVEMTSIDADPIAYVAEVFWAKPCRINGQLETVYFSDLDPLPTDEQLTQAWCEYVKSGTVK